MNHTAASRRIVSRHQASAEEGGRCCDACGRPWPCDVSVLARELEIVNVASPALTASAAPSALVRRSSRKRAPLVVAR
jgi:hypothetical protein